MGSQFQYQKHHTEQNGFNHSQVAIVMVPFPLQGHLNQILHLSCLLSFYEVSLHFAGSTTHNKQAKLRIQGSKVRNLSKIHFHDFQLPPFTCFSPDPSAPIKFPGHLQPLFYACTHLRGPMSQLLQDLSKKFRKVVVIHDTLMASVVQDVKHISNAESFALQSVSAFTVFLYIWDSMEEKPFQIDPEMIPCIPSSKGCFTLEFANFIAKEYEVLDFESGRLFNTCRLLEGKYMELLERLPINTNKKLFAVGPVNPMEFKSKNNQCTKHKCLEWLDKQEKNSVLYVSFGTTTSMSADQIKELATGLQRSGHKFIWILRDADKDDVFAEEETRSPELPKGYEERVKNRGMVVRDWAPQLEILDHTSTGGFMSHCGWNSSIESISMGVPIAAWPMHSDQPRNAVLIAQVLKIGIEVRNWAQREELVEGEIVESVVKRLMGSEEMRRRAEEIGAVIRGAVADGGASRLEMDSFIAYINR